MITCPRSSPLSVPLIKITLALLVAPKASLRLPNYGTPPAYPLCRVDTANSGAVPLAYCEGVATRDPTINAYPKAPA